MRFRLFYAAGDRLIFADERLPFFLAMITAALHLGEKRAPGTALRNSLTRHPRTILLASFETS